MAEFEDLIGKRFGILTVRKRTENAKNGTARWICLCDCGKETVALSTKLRNGHIKSCGCLKRARNGKSKTRLYRIYNGMKARCEKATKDNYKFYGARGISICAEWQDFECFWQWAISNGYDDGLSIDRINPDKGYCPDNCRWITIQEQQNNKRSNVILEYNGKQYTKSQLAKKLGYKYYTLDNRIRMGWTIEKIANTPERKHGK